MIKQLAWIGALFGVFIISMFVVSPWIQKNWIEANQPYLIVDPELRAETGCTYDYLTYIPIEVTGRDPKDGVIFPVTSVQAGAVQYVHYPESWTNPWNPFNPANAIGNIINVVGTILIWVLGTGIIVYLIILWRKGALKKMAEELKGEEYDF
jgi:hypothetical protein